MVKELGQRLRKLRKGLGLKQKEFASRVPGKMDYTYVGKIERGEQYPSLKMLERIGRAFDVPLGYFFEDSSFIKELELLPHDIKRLLTDRMRQELLRATDRLTRKDLSSLLMIADILARPTREE